MKYKLLLLFLVISLNGFSQTDVFYYKDTTNNLSLRKLEKIDFKYVENQILEDFSNKTYWFKIPSTNSKSTYVFRILYERITDADVYQDSEKLTKLPNQRYLTYQFKRDADVYVKIKPNLHAYLPFELIESEKSYIKEKNSLLINGFYYGFAFLVIIYNLFYYILFKDEAFLYYALFLTSASFGVFTMDGMLNYLNITGIVNDSIMILNYFFLAFFSSKFANSYLFLESYYPNLKRFSYTIGAIIIVFGISYLITHNYYTLLLLNIFVFSLLVIYWLSSVLLFKENVYTKFLSIAYIIVLLSAIDFFILKFLGISFINIDGTTILKKPDTREIEDATGISRSIRK